MKLIIQKDTNPFRNLAAEEILLLHANSPCIYLWRNRPSVIVGQNQDVLSEVNKTYAEDNGIDIARRITGGGTVYHDLGNINISYIFRCNEEKDFDDHIHDFIELIIAYLQSIGVKPVLTGRNDICIYDNEGNLRKIAGTAMTQRGSQGLFHFCLLYDTDRTKMDQVLTPPLEKLASKGVASVYSRTINLREIYPQFADKSGTSFFANMMQYFSSFAEIETIPKKLESSIDDLTVHKYTQPNWIFNRKTT